MDCFLFCLSQWPKCKSINYQKKETQSICQLNNQTRETKPGELVQALAFNYYEQSPIRSALYGSLAYTNVAFQGVFKLKNLKTKRLLFSSGARVEKKRGSEGGVSNENSIFGSDANYYDRVWWKISNDGQGRYLFENHRTKRYLFSMGDEIPGDRGCEGGITEAPLCLGSDDNYDNRALWRIINKDGKYLIENVVNLRYVLSEGEPPTHDEGGWIGAPRCVMADANYEDRALWRIISKV
ncbi:uncharacterized protein LOC114519745 [Dendronephthya gigantea]|uniref:uncharacterized protein LOC114519745 n=1 Tax=Dendronephthya gigantea TaxID=151771 RepID=UPI00106DCC34|nr:uncharacterized protein LOC114519745 [Dendronephthya gigantea]